MTIYSKCRGYILCLSIIFVSLANAGVHGLLSYDILGDSVTITACDVSAVGFLEVPADIDGLTVTAIDYRAFYSCSDLTQVTLPEGIVSIGLGAFMHCSNLISINLPANLTTIGGSAFYACYDLTDIAFPNGLKIIEDSAFSFCNSLTSIHIPASVNSIGGRPFFSCNDLSAITVDAANVNYESVDGVLFNESMTSLIQYPGAKRGAYIVPSGVESIGESAFAYTSMTSIDFPATITNLDNYVFFRIDDLQAITVDSMNQYYTSVNGVLFDKSMTELIRYPITRSGSYSVPLGVTSINDLSFQDCSELSAISLPISVTSIGYRTFEDCRGLISITLPAALERIGQRAFADCDRFTSVMIPATVTEIGSQPFGYCDNLATITVESGNTEFHSIDGLLYDTDASRLIQCPIQKSGKLTLPDGLRVINYGALYRCASLTDVILPESLITIESYAFSWCEGLTSMVLPPELYELGFRTFSYCESLTHVTFMGDAPFSEGDVFYQLAPDFAVHYYTYRIGFSSPTWRTYPAVGLSDPVAGWLHAHGYPIDTPIGLQDENGDGVDLLTAYALNLDPRQDLSDSLPKAFVESGQMKIQYYADALGVRYVLETSTDLRNWTTVGVALSPLDVNRYCTGSIESDVRCRFMRLRTLLPNKKMKDSGWSVAFHMKNDPVPLSVEWKNIDRMIR